MNELIAAFTTPYTMQSVNLMLTYWECYICIALFARRFERRDFFFVRIALTLLAGGLLYLFLGTRLGLSIRATGDNADMVRASSINPAFTITVGL